LAAIMKIIIAPDSFKGNMSALVVCAAIEEGILRADPSAKVHKVPLADGGEGTARAVTEAAAPETKPVSPVVAGPDGVLTMPGTIGAPGGGISNPAPDTGGANIDSFWR
jgi:glycerate kinase